MFRFTRIILLGAVIVWFQQNKLSAQVQPGTILAQDRFKVPSWFSDARFGLFIHWGVYSIPAGYWNGKAIEGPGEWIMYNAKIPVKEYEPLAAKFNPAGFSAEKWVALAREAGMKYLVFTAKHCDGFALYNSKVSSYNIVSRTPFKRDVLMELQQACIKNGMELGFYYSHNWDWHEPDALGLDNTWDFPAHATKKQENYFNSKSLPQVTELVRNYQPDLLWFDVPTTIEPFQSREFLDTIRKYRPACIVNDRIGNGYGDYLTPEQYVPAAGSRELFESCMTLNDTWGFKANDFNWKPAPVVIKNLVEVVSKGGNYLLNVGPDEQGNFPAEAIRILQEVGKWMNQHGESIYGSSASPLGTLPFGLCTSKPGKLFFHVVDWPENGQLILPGILAPVTGVYLLTDPEHKQLSFRKISEMDIMVTLDPSLIKSSLLNDIDNVLVLEYKGNAAFERRPLMVNTNYSTAFLPAEAAVIGDSLRYEFNNLWDETRGYITSNWILTGDKFVWQYRLLEDGWFDIEITYGAPAEVSGSVFRISSGEETIPAEVENTGGYYKFRTCRLGRMHLKANAAGTVEIMPGKLKGGSMMNLVRLRFVPVPRQALINPV